VPSQKITVRSRKYDMKVRRTWTCEILYRSDDLIQAVGVFDLDVEHAGLGSIARGTVSHEFYWFRRWYNVFRFHEPAGAFRNYYCNISMPATVEGDVVDYVDLDIDVVVWKDLSYDVLDRDDFERNTLKYGYPPHIVEKAHESLDELIRMIAARQFPFETHLD
jgi:protein associated with RNAse G/E